MRSLAALPKAHLHLHFTGSLHLPVLIDLAAKHGIRLPDALGSHWPPQLSGADERGWFRFQRLYDTARACVRDEDDMRLVVRGAAEADLAEGSRWLELQIDPTTYAAHLGGITPTLEIVLDEARSVSATSGIGVAIVVAANRTRHPLDARTLARLAARYAGEGAGSVVGFGLSNDERRGVTADFGPAFAIARRAGLAAVPHGGELLGPEHLAEVLDSLGPTRIGHGVRSVEDPRVLDAVARAGIGLEVCPGSNLAMGVFGSARDVPLRRIYDAGIPVALGADDPLLFGERIVAQYAVARDALGFTDAELAELARQSFRISRAPQPVIERALRDIDAWLAAAP